jgi:hypothetical protein
VPAVSVTDGRCLHPLSTVSLLCQLRRRDVGRQLFLQRQRRSALRQYEKALTVLATMEAADGRGDAALQQRRQDKDELEAVMKLNAAA